MVDYLLCADWSKQYKGRALYAADVRARKLFRVGPAIFVCRGFWGKDAEEGAGPAGQNVEAAVYRNGGKRAGEAAGT